MPNDALDYRRSTAISPTPTVRRKRLVRAAAQRLGQVAGRSADGKRVAAILIAGASSYERRSVERALEKTGRSLRSVADPAEAERVCAEDGGASILVIDSGLLEAPRDARWRKLRSRHPELAVVMCSRVSRHEIQRRDRNTLLVHPINGAGICDAIDLLDSYRLGGMPAPWMKHVSVSGRARRAPVELSP